MGASRPSVSKETDAVTYHHLATPYDCFLTPFGTKTRRPPLNAAQGMEDRGRGLETRPAESEQIDLLLGDVCSLPVAADAVAVVFIEYTLELFS